MNSEVGSGLSLIRPDWPAPSNIRAVCTTRSGGVSQCPWASLNLGDHVSDEIAHVRENRSRLANACGLPTKAFGWLSQVHGTEVVSLPIEDASLVPKADASVTRVARKA
ncbi:MAG: laccase domain-containing protein, partial [Marinobacter sp.]